MRTVEIQLDEEESLELESIDVGVEERVLSFDISGTIRSDGDALDGLVGESLQPTTVIFETV